MKKTNAARILEGLGISFSLQEYEVDEDDLGAENVARKIGMPLERVFKTLVARGDKNGPLVACIPGGAELDLKRLAAASGNKRVELVPLKDVQPLTGYLRGGCSPLGMRKPYPVFLDASALSFEKISVSAGTRGCQMILAPADLVRAASATVAELCRKE